MRRARAVELPELSMLVPDCPVCEAPDAVGDVGSLVLPDAAGGAPDGTVDWDDCAYAPVASIVQSASEPIPSTFLLKLMCIPLRGANPHGIGMAPPRCGLPRTAAKTGRIEKLH